ncbi:hypothetical protein GCM10007100_10710 [Roseibacillus persicicus]|uniref:Uncharacterized protein n=1 Tax=Roseibacillus persicicus TaxID=454148 RepID=A0A918TIU0_9BACT|nr:hypothetical protein GCM10007100_10710 [Roseibacillus persicicus]
MVEWGGDPLFLLVGEDGAGGCDEGAGRPWSAEGRGCEGTEWWVEQDGTGLTGVLWDLDRMNGIGQNFDE